MYPSVTTILRAVGLSREYPEIPAMQAHRDRGSALHLAIKYHLDGILDESSLHPAIRPGFEAFLEFKAKHGLKHIYSELEIASTEHGVVGHLDFVGQVNGTLAIVDWKGKSIDDPGYRYQLGGYALLWQGWQDRGIYGPAPRRYLVGLGTGKPEMKDVTDPYAIEVFKAALMVYRARENGK